MGPNEIRQIALFKNLDDKHLALIADLSVEERFRTGKIIFREGSAGDRLYVIADGRVRISKRIPGIGEEALAILNQGDYFGEMGLIDDFPRSADAIAHNDCTLYSISKEELEGLLFVNRDLAYEILWNFVRTLSSRLRDTNEKIKVFFALNAGF